MKNLVLLIFSILTLLCSSFKTMADIYDPNDLATVNQIKSQGGTCVTVWNDMLPKRLEYLMVSGNMTGSLVIVDCIYLKYLDFNGVQMQALTVTGCNSLETVGCSSSQVMLIQLNNNKRLKGLVCNKNPQLIYLDVNNSPRLEGINATNTKIKTLKIDGDTALTKINCDSNLTTKITVSGKTKATVLSLQGSINLTSFICTGTTLSKLNLSKCTNLITLDCSTNTLTSLDVSDCAKLANIDCSKNQLDTINLINDTALKGITLNCNHLTDESLPFFYTLNLGRDSASYQLDLRDNHEFTENAIKTLDQNLQYTSSEQIIWNPFIKCTTELDWIKKTKNSPEHPKGVVCDSVSSILINLKTDSDFSTDKITVKLSDLNGDDTEPLGMIGLSKDSAISTSLTINNPNKNEYSLYYVAPDVFTNKIDSKESMRKVIVEIKLDCSRTYKDTIRIFRPPVLLIHGLNDTSKTFADLQDDLINSGRYISDMQAYTVDYSYSNQDAFADNKNVVPSNIFNIIQFWKRQGIEISKVDIVGHSMGGVLSRLYLQSNMYQDNIHKLITLNTPHSGSQGANLIFPLVVGGKKLTDYFFNSNYYEGAWRDLQVNSDATRVLLNGDSILNKNIVPSHVIVTKADKLTTINQRNPTAIAIYVAIKLSLVIIDEICEKRTGLNPHLNNLEDLGEDIIEKALPILYDGDNDFVVAVKSQEGGLSSSATTLVDKEWHCGSPSNPTVKSKIAELLELPTSNSSFSKDGFHPPTLTWGLETKSSKLKSDVEINDSIFFVLPKNNITAKSGETVNVKMKRSSGVRNLIFIAMESKDSVFLKDTTAMELNINYSIPASSIGRIPMYVFGADTLGNTFVDSVFITVQPNAIPQSLNIQPSDSIILYEGLKGGIQVSCLFSDGITRDVTTLPDVLYSTKTGNAINISQGILKGVKLGLDTLIVTYGSLSCKLPIVIEQNFMSEFNFKWNGTNTWDKSENWTPSIIPATDAEVTVESGELTVNQNATVSNLTINSGANISINTGDTLKITGDLTIKSDATLVDNGKVTVLGSTKVEQYLTGSGNVTPKGRFWYVSSPVTGATSNIFDAGGANKVWYYSELTHAYNEILDNTTSLNVGTGYVARLVSNDTVTFSGLLNTGNQTFYPTRTGTDNEKRGFNLVGNPYPSYLDWISASKTNILPTVWFRSMNNSNVMVFDTYNALLGTGISASGNPISEFIPPLQAFWVKVETDNSQGTLAFDNSMRSHRTDGLKSGKTNDLIRLEVSNGVNRDETVIAFNAGASDGFDSFDSPKISNDNSMIPELYTLADSEHVAINGLKSNETDNSIPLGFNTSKAGTFTISATEINGLNGFSIILEDKAKNTSQYLTESTTYSFTSDSSDNASRFVIHLKAEMTGNNIEKDDIIVYTKNHLLFVNTTLDNSDGTIILYDVLGREIIEGTLTGVHSVLDLSINSGVYFVKVQTHKSVVMKQIVVE